jgi:hypothetical protein
LGFFNKSVQQANGIFVETVEYPHFLLATHPKLKQGARYFFTVRHSQFIAKPFQQINSTQSFSDGLCFQEFYKFLYVIVNVDLHNGIVAKNPFTGDTKSLRGLLHDSWVISRDCNAKIAPMGDVKRFGELG